MNASASETTRPSGQSSPRRWYRLHASTYVVLLLTAIVLFFVNVPGQYTVHIDLFNPARWGPFGGDYERIEHGWPWSYLVREDRHHREPETGDIRATRIWSFTEDRLAFHPWRLVANSSVGGLALAGCVLAFEYWRRQRQRIWQLRITDLFGITAIVAATLWSGLQSRKEFLRDMAATREAGVPLDERGAPIYMSCGTGLPDYFRTRGGPSWLREACGEDFPPWWDRTVLLGLESPTFNLADLADLQLLSMRFRHGLSTANLIALERLPNLKALRIVHLAVGDNAGPAERDEIGDERDHAIASILRHARRTDTLERLAVWYTAFGSQATSALSALSELRVLDLADCELGEEGLRQVSRLPRLEDLNLDQSDTSDAGLRHLVESNVRRLSLRGCTLTNATLRQLACMQSLEELNLSRSLIDPECLELLARLPRLQRLSLPCGIEPTTLARLKQANARLRIEYVD